MRMDVSGRASILVIPASADRVSGNDVGEWGAR